jgi:dipeptidyl aminopeptidase/acylaminoacyl peptidase
MLLSGTVNFHRALLGKGADARLVVFDAMPHAHWYTVGIPEATQALELMARFFDEQLARQR